MRWRKPLLVAAIVVALLVLACAVTLHVLVDPDKLKAMAQDRARTAFGRELRIEHLETKYLPFPGLRARGVQLDQPALAIEQLDLSAGILPLLSGEVRDVTFTARFVRNGQALDVVGVLDDPLAPVSNGHLELAWKETKLVARGRIPLGRGTDGHDLEIAAESKSLEDVFTFLGFQRGPTAPMTLKAQSRGVEGRADVSGLALAIGDLKVRGELQVALGDKRRVTGRLESDRIDWLKTLRQTGGTVKPPRHDDQIYHADPVAWHAIGLVGAIDGAVDLAIAGLKLGNGVELRDIRTRASMGDGKLALESLALSLLGGSARGSLRFDAPQKSIRAELDGDRLELGQWFRERGSKIPFTGGPMRVRAKITLQGETFRDLAASINGPVTVRVGRGTWANPKAGEVEEMMVAALASRGSRDLRFECMGANLDFKRGRAEGRRVFGARSDVSQLLTSGTVDFREEKLDLRGRVQARKGVTIGLAAVAGGIQIAGPLAKPKVQLDADERPAVLARAAAAIATAGATLAGEALLNAMAKDDPCEAVFK